MDRKYFVIIFTILGLLIGIVTANIKSQLTIFSLLVAGYLVVFLPIYIKYKKTEKEMNKLILETIANYLLTWLVVFFLISNL